MSKLPTTSEHKQYWIIRQVLRDAHSSRKISTIEYHKALAKLDRQHTMGELIKRQIQPLIEMMP